MQEAAEARARRRMQRDRYERVRVDLGVDRERREVAALIVELQAYGDEDPIDVSNMQAGLAATDWSDPT